MNAIWDAFAKRVWVQMHRKDGRRVLRKLVVEGCKMSDFGKLRSLCPRRLCLMSKNLEDQGLPKFESDTKTGGLLASLCRVYKYTLNVRVP